MKIQILPLSLPDNNNDNDKKGNNIDYEYSNNPGIVVMVDVLEALFTYICGPIFHTYGNHELHNLDRGKLGVFSIYPSSNKCVVNSGGIT